MLSLTNLWKKVLFLVVIVGLGTIFLTGRSAQAQSVGLPREELAADTLPVRALAAPMEKIGSGQASACNQPTHYIFPSVTLNATNGPRFARIRVEVDKDCHVVEKERTVLMNIPAEILDVAPPQFTKPLSSRIPLGVVPFKHKGDPTNTAHVNIWEQDIVGIHTVELDTAQTWSWDGNTVSLGGWSSPASWCCYWWHISSGPSFSNGYDSTFSAWAHGAVSFYCSGSAFCPGSTHQYPISLSTWLHLYADGSANYDGTGYSGQVIPGGDVQGVFWVQ